MRIQDLTDLFLSPQQMAALTRGNITNISDLLLGAPAALAKKMKISLSETYAISIAVCKVLASRCTPLVYELPGNDDLFTSGDSFLDIKLGGGIRTGMVWEIAGESGAGKSQLAMQLALAAQIPRRFGGLSASSCYLTTQTRLPTQRLLQLSENHPLLSTFNCTLSDIHTQLAPTYELLMQSLTTNLPLLINRNSADKKRQLKLLVIDTITALLYSEGTTTNRSLIDRSKAIADLGVMLHGLATKYRIAIVVLNEVTDVFEPDTDVQTICTDDIYYRKQKRVFNFSQVTQSPENRKEAALGLVWANQVNVRIILKRTNCKRAIGNGVYDERVPKKRRLDRDINNDSIEEDTLNTTYPYQLSLIRQLSVVFSSVSSPGSADYIITSNGVVLLSDNVNGDSPYAVEDDTEGADTRLVNPLGIRE